MKLRGIGTKLTATIAEPANRAVSLSVIAFLFATLALILVVGARHGR